MTGNAGPYQLDGPVFSGVGPVASLAPQGNGAQNLHASDCPVCASMKKPVEGKKLVESEGLNLENASR